MSNTLTRSQDGFFDRLKEQVDFLKKSAESYDSGHEHESQRMAIALRILLHDTKNQTCLLTHLKCKDKLNFVDTGVYQNDIEAAQKAFLTRLKMTGMVDQACGDTGLAIVVIGRDAFPRYAAPLAQPRKFRNIVAIPPKADRLFTDWWHEKFIEDAKFNLMSRADLILTVANKDGGGHVDKELDADYVQFCEEGWGGQFAPGVDLTQTNDPSAFKTYQGNAVSASVRQVAYEVLTTLEKKFGESLLLSTQQK